MFGYNDLKEHILVTPSTVECPIKGCAEIVTRQRGQYIQDLSSKCPNHNIYLWKTTFEYDREESNLLWTAPEDLDLLNQIKKVKRESRMARDNSEDAVSWNIFRFLEKEHLTESVFSSVLGMPINSTQTIYWSYDQKNNNQWTLLNQARLEFGETIKRGSEPDIIIKTDNQLLFIEAKFNAMNVTKPSANSKVDSYVNGGDRWFSNVFNADFQTIAVQEQKYELMRFWLLGTWLANKLKLDFYLLNLVLSENEKTIEPTFRKLIQETETRHFKRITWEEIYSSIINTDISSPDQQYLINYFKNKTTGYTIDGNLRRIFQI